MKLTRRDFLRQCAAIGASSAVSSVLPGCGMCLGPAPLPEIPSTPKDQRATVYSILGDDLRAMTLEAIEAVGGMASFVSPNETVFVKANLGTAGFVRHDIFQTGECTKPEIIITVAEECLKAGAAEVIIGEAGQTDRFDWATLRALDDSADLATEAKRLSDQYAGKVTLACLEVESPEWDPIDSPWTGLEHLYISSLLARADRVITLPVFKTHRWCHVTGGLKNFVGTTSRAHYGPGSANRTALHQAAGGVEQCFLDIVAAVKPVLSIMDMSVCCEGDGPHVLPGWWGTTIDVKDRLGSWLILVGTDLPAVDATAARIVGQDVAAVNYLNWAYHQGLGQIQQDKIDLVGPTLTELAMDWQPARQTEGFCEVIIPGIMMMFERPT
ncbi:MAG: DUF362 domain-containing protein [Phycisphaerae bacterium]|nr:DUF362 domain-containing protein [Phycisphaerae bacterium]